MKLAILGAENSHAWFFAQAIDGKDGTKMFDDVELLGVYADSSTEEGQFGIEKVKEMSNCARFAEHYNDFLDEADVIMVTARHGGNHLKFARDYIKKGIPVWIDKPITCSTEDVRELIDLAGEYNSLLLGGSGLPYIAQMKKLAAVAADNMETLKGGHVTAPVNMENPYGDFWFYTQHLVQMMTSVFGYEVKSVSAERVGDGVRAVYHYDKYDVTAFYGSGYSVTIYKDGFSLVSEEVSLGDDFYNVEMQAFYDNLKNGKPDYTEREFAMPVYVLDATIKAFTEGKEIVIENPYK